MSLRVGFVPLAVLLVLSFNAAHSLETNMMPPNYGMNIGMFGAMPNKTGYAPMQPNQMQTGYQPDMQTIQPVGNTAIANPVAPPMQTTQPFAGWNGGMMQQPQMQTGFQGMPRIDPRMFQQMMQRPQMAMRPQSLFGRQMGG
jgi:hypothetical protein